MGLDLYWVFMIIPHIEPDLSLSLSPYTDDVDVIAYNHVHISTCYFLFNLKEMYIYIIL